MEREEKKFRLVVVMVMEVAARQVILFVGDLYFVAETIIN